MRNTENDFKHISRGELLTELMREEGELSLMVRAMNMNWPKAYTEIFEGGWEAYNTTVSLYEKRLRDGLVKPVERGDV